MNTDVIKKSHDLLHSNHQSWLQHPVTQSSKQLLDEQIALISEHIAKNALSKDVPDTFIRHYAAQLAVLKTIKKNTYDTETFIARLNPN